MLEPKRAVSHYKAKGLDLSRILHKPAVPAGTSLCAVESQEHGLGGALDHQLIALCKPALEHGKKVRHALPIKNVHRTVCTMLSSEISRRYGADGLPAGTIELEFQGSAGQSFGAFMANGIWARIEGDANDYVGKGMSGGRIVVLPPKAARFAAEENIVVGNVALYGATGGEAFLRGRAGERFCVRNSGATAVVEGVGDHGCEYMTRGIALVLGRTGRNFAAGMSGGVAYVLDEDSSFESRCNLGLVDLEPLEPADEVTVKDLIERHYALTGSSVAERLLQTWTETARMLVKVFPRDYKRVLAEQRYDSEIAALATGP